jgi:hypothetical protein
MIVFVNEQFTPELQEPDNFRAFSLEIAIPKGMFDDVRAALADFVDFESESGAWVQAEALQAIAPSGGSETWRADFARMIEKARPHGWIRDVPEVAIRAHVVWAAGQ